MVSSGFICGFPEYGALRYIYDFLGCGVLICVFLSYIFWIPRICFYGYAFLGCIYGFIGYGVLSYIYRFLRHGFLGHGFLGYMVS